MKHFDHPSKAPDSRSSASIQRVQSPSKTVVDNRRSIVTQLRLQAAISTSVGTYGKSSAGQSRLKPIQRVLDPTTRRLKSTETTWQELVESAPVPLSKIKIGVIERFDHDDAISKNLRTEFAKLKDINSELDNIPPGKNTTKYKNRIKDRIEGQYQRVVDLAHDAYGQQQDIVNTIITTAVGDIRAYADRADRKRPNGQPIPQGTLTQKEKDDVVGGIIDNWHNRVHWRDPKAFKDAVKNKYESEKDSKHTGVAVNSEAQQKFNEETGLINAQLAIWNNNLSYNAPGCNAAGTWGTSSTGVTNFTISKVTPEVWAKLRSWWLKKPNAFITASDTSNWSLKMDRDGDDDTLSPRMNYHINVAVA